MKITPGTVSPAESQASNEPVKVDLPVSRERTDSCAVLGLFEAMSLPFNGVVTNGRTDSLDNGRLIAISGLLLEKVPDWRVDGRERLVEGLIL